MNWLHFFSLFSKTLTPTRSLRSSDAVVFAVFPYSSGAVSAGSSTGQHMFMAQYLVESCGFDQNKAANASKLLRGIKSRQQPDSVLAFFKSYGFEDKSVKKILFWFPQCLLLDVEKSLAPKFRAFHDLGLSRSDVVQLVQSNPIAIKYKIESILSKIQFWQSLVGSEVFLLKFLKYNQWFLGYSIQKRVQPNLKILQECGVTGQKLSAILKHHPRFVVQKPVSLKSLVTRVENFGVPRTSGMFHLTLRALYTVNPKKFKLQMELFKGFGWSEDDFVVALRKCPAFLTLPPKTLQRKMEFFVNEAGYASSDVMMCPIMLAFSLEKRSIPRYKILTFLKFKGYCKRAIKLSTILICSEKTFLKRYILRYKNECPDMIEFYASLKKSNASDAVPH